MRVEQALLENADSVGRGYVVSFATQAMVLKRSAKAAVDIPGTTLLGPEGRSSGPLRDMGSGGRSGVAGACDSPEMAWVCHLRSVW